MTTSVSICLNYVMILFVNLKNGIIQTPILETLRVFQSLRKKYIIFDIDIHNPKGIKLITRLRKHKFKHSFQDTINPFCTCGQNIESTAHFFLHCPFFVNERRTLLSTICSLDNKMLDCTDYDLTKSYFLATHPKFQAIISKSLTH